MQRSGFTRHTFTLLSYFCYCLPGYAHLDMFLHCLVGILKSNKNCSDQFFIVCNDSKKNPRFICVPVGDASEHRRRFSQRLAVASGTGFCGWHLEAMTAKWQPFLLSSSRCFCVDPMMCQLPQERQTFMLCYSTSLSSTRYALGQHSPCFMNNLENRESYYTMDHHVSDITVKCMVDQTKISHSL